MVAKDFENWQAVGSAVFLKQKLVLAPGVENMKGVVYTTKSMPLSSVRGWEAHIDLDIGSDSSKHVGNGGFALYYLRNADVD